MHFFLEFYIYPIISYNYMINKKTNNEDTMKTKRYGYGVYHVEINGQQDWSIVNSNMYGDLGYTAWTVFDDRYNGSYKGHEAIDTFNTLREAKEFIQNEISKNNNQQ